MKKFSMLSVLLVSAVLLCSAYVNAEPVVTPIEKLISEMADKPADHKAIAEYYRSKAADAKTEVTLHQSMQKSYMHTSNAQHKGKAFGKNTEKHCDQLIKAYETAVTEYEALAELHETEASK